MSKKTFNAVLVSIGVLTLVPGLLEILFSLMGNSLVWGKVAFRGDFMFWRGIILTSSGIFFVLSAYDPTPVEKRARAILASSMIWIVAGVEAASLVLGAIPGDGSRWFNSPTGFLNSFSGPFNPSIYLLPISLALALLVFSRVKIHDEER